MKADKDELALHSSLFPLHLLLPQQPSKSIHPVCGSCRFIETQRLRAKFLKKKKDFLLKQNTIQVLTA